MKSTGYSNLLKRFYPKKFSDSKKIIASASRKTPEERKILAYRFISEAEKSLLKGDFDAIGLLNAASNLGSSNADLWYRQGLALFEYGMQKGLEKALMLAAKSFRQAVKIRPEYPEAYFSWGLTLLELAQTKNETHYFYDAKEKTLKALEFSDHLSCNTKAECYWNLGVIWTYIAENSGEALDVKAAIQAFRESLQLFDPKTASFWNDFGRAYLQMGLFINDSRHYLQAIEHFKKASAYDETSFDAWHLLADSYSELYINTMNEDYFSEANQSYRKACALDEESVEAWLGWAELLGESGKLTSEPKLLRLSIEKCIKAHSLAPKNSKIISQWVESLSLLGANCSRYDLLIEAENKILRASEIYDEDPDIWYAYAVCIMSMGDYHEDIGYYDLAIEKIQTGLSLDRTSSEHWHLLALCHMRIGALLNDEELFSLASKFFKRAIFLKPSCPSLIFDFSLSLLKRAEITQDVEDAKAAIEQFEYAIQLQQNALLYHPEHLYSYGSALHLYGELEEEEGYLLRAIEVFWQVLLIEPDFPNIHYKLAVSYAHLADYNADAHLYQKAFNYFKIAATHTPEHDDLYLEWGLALINFAHHTYDFGKPSFIYLEAEQKIIKAGNLGNQYAYYHLACLYSLTGKVREAVLLLEKARRLDVLPDVEELMHDEWLDPIRNTDSFALFISRLENSKKH